MQSAAKRMARSSFSLMCHDRISIGRKEPCVSAMVVADLGLRYESSRMIAAPQPKSDASDTIVTVGLHKIMQDPFQ